MSLVKTGSGLTAAPALPFPFRTVYAPNYPSSTQRKGLMAAAVAVFVVVAIVIGWLLTRVG